MSRGSTHRHMVEEVRSSSQKQVKLSLIEYRRRRKVKRKMAAQSRRINRD